MARYKRSYKKRKFSRKSSSGFRKKNQGFMARRGKKSPLSSRGWKGMWKGAKPELKFHDTVFQEVGAIGATGAMVYEGLVGGAATVTRVRPCNLIGQGTDYNHRIGRKILIKSVYTRITIQPENAGLLDSNATARTVLIWDLQPNGGAAPNLTDIFELFAAGTTTMNSTNLMNLNYRERFVVLWDKVYTLGHMAAAAANGESCRVIKKYKKVNLSVTYNSTGDAIGDIATGSLLLVTLGDATGNFPVGVGVVRIRYTDA